LDDVDPLLAAVGAGCVVIRRDETATHRGSLQHSPNESAYDTTRSLRNRPSPFQALVPPRSEAPMTISLVVVPPDPRRVRRLLKRSHFQRAASASLLSRQASVPISSRLETRLPPSETTYPLHLVLGSIGCPLLVRGQGGHGQTQVDLPADRGHSTEHRPRPKRRLSNREGQTEKVHSRPEPHYAGRYWLRSTESSVTSS
ncbi:hypothetical protein THAOC_17495, partial [Thalassiosira oceanica]